MKLSVLKKQKYKEICMKKIKKGREENEFDF